MGGDGQQFALGLVGLFGPLPRQRRLTQVVESLLAQLQHQSRQPCTHQQSQQQREQSVVAHHRQPVFVMVDVVIKANEAGEGTRGVEQRGMGGDEPAVLVGER